MKKGFTLVELVIVIVIVGVLSIVAVPIYKGYVEKAKLTEGMAALSAIKIAQDVYFAQHENYYSIGIAQYDDVLGIDLRTNKYFKYFDTNNNASDHGYARVHNDSAYLTYDWVRPGTAGYKYGGTGKSAPYMYYVDEDGKQMFL